MMVTFWPHNTKPIALKWVICHVLVLLRKLASHASLAIQPKSLCKFNLRLLVATCMVVGWGLSINKVFFCDTFLKLAKISV